VPLDDEAGDETIETEYAYNAGHESITAGWQAEEDDDIVSEDVALEDEGDIVVLDDVDADGEATFQYNDDQDARIIADQAAEDDAGGYGAAIPDEGPGSSGAVAIPGFD
jgi:hypothetical protein